MKTPHRAVRIPLTEQQRRIIFEATGDEVSEAIIARPMDVGPTLDGEVDDTTLAEAVWNGSGEFRDRLSDYPALREHYEAYIEHSIDLDEPFVVILR